MCISQSELKLPNDRRLIDVHRVVSAAIDNDNTFAVNFPLPCFSEAILEFCRKRFSEGPSGLIDMERKVREVFGSDVSRALEQDVATMIRSGADCKGKLVDEGKSWFEARKESSVEHGVTLLTEQTIVNQPSPEFAAHDGIPTSDITSEVSRQSHLYE